MSEKAGFGSGFPTPGAESEPLQTCPKCGSEDSMEHFKVRVPDAPLDADWDECVVCGYRSDPE